jgi:hypothetical protein
MPEWALIVVALAALAALGAAWPPLALVTVPLFLVAASAPVAQAAAAALRADFPTPASRTAEIGKRLVTAFLHLIQPAARLIGRLQHGLLPWRRRGNAQTGLAWPRRRAIWSESWRAPECWTQRFEDALKAQGAVVLRSGEFDRWDLHVRGGLFGAARGLLAIEEHGAGKQLVRIAVQPWAPPMLMIVTIVLLTLSALALVDRASFACGVLSSVGVLLVYLHMRDSARAAAAWGEATDAQTRDLGGG